MAADEKSLSPEEKLLKVIQGDEAETGSSAEGPAPGSRPAPSSRAEPAGRPRLKLAEDDAGGRDRGKRESGSGEKRTDDVPVPAAADEGVAKKRDGRLAGIRGVNLALAVVVMLMIGFAAWEIWASVSVGDDLPPVPPAQVELPRPVATDLPPLEGLLTRFSETDIFHLRELPATVSATSRVERAAPPDVEKYVRNLNLIGISLLPGTENGEREAIIVNRNEDDKLHIMQSGDTLSVGDRTLVLQEVFKDRVVLFDGANELTLE